MVCGACCSVVFKFAFLTSGILSVAGAIILWDRNVFNLQDDALARYNHDVLSFWVAWTLCFFGYYFKQTACVVLTAGVILASLTYRQTVGNHGNLASVAGANMCRVLIHDSGNAINTAATWDPDFATRNDNNTYSFSMDRTQAIYCVLGDVFLYVGLIVGLCCACSAGSDSREESPCWTRLLALAVLVIASVGSMVVLLADAATPSAATYGIVFDQCTLTVLAGVYTSIAYFGNNLPLAYAAAVLAAYSAVTNLAVMWISKGSTSADISNLESGFILNEIAMVTACVLTLLNTAAGGGMITKTHTKIVPVMSPVAADPTIPRPHGAPNTASRVLHPAYTRPNKDPQPLV